MVIRRPAPPSFEVPQTILEQELRARPQTERLGEAIRLRLTTARYVGMLAGLCGPKMSRLIRGQEPTYREAVRIGEILRVDPGLLFGAHDRAASRPLVGYPRSR